MSTLPYKPVRQGIHYPKPSREQWRRILRKCQHAETGFSSPCWIWCGRIDTEGYGECKYNGAKRFTHRIAYAWRTGKAPANRVIDHKCQQRACCNPAHLRAMTADRHNAKSGLTDSAPLQVNRDNINIPF